MALRESDHSATPAASSIKKPRDMVTKSPARELHRFSNGVLDVTPKGGKEEAMVLENQKSPLLRLPREIRDCIWSYALDGPVLFVKEHVYTQSLKLVPGTARPINNVALLRTCRQIYSETALFPLRSGTIACDGICNLLLAVMNLQKYQCEQVTKLRLDCVDSYMLSLWTGEHWPFRSWDLKTIFPSIREIEITVYEVTNEGDTESQDNFRRGSEELKDMGEHYGCQLTIRGTPEVMNIALYREF